MEPFTVSDLKRAREEFVVENNKKYIEEAVRTIYHDVKKYAIEMNGDSYFYTIHWEVYRNVRDVAETIRRELQLLFPGFMIKIGHENDGCGSLYISVQW